MSNERAQRMIEMRDKQKLSLREIGRREGGISGSRVSQIIQTEKRKAANRGFIGLDVSTRARRALEHYHPPLESIEDIRKAVQTGNFEKIPNVGRKTANEIREAVGLPPEKKPAPSPKWKPKPLHERLEFMAMQMAIDVTRAYSGSAVLQSIRLFELSDRVRARSHADN